MAKQAVLEREMGRWRGLSLALLLFLGIVGALSYTLIVQQNAIIQDMDVQITRLTDKLRNLDNQESITQR